MKRALAQTRSIDRPSAIVPFRDWDYFYLNDVLTWKAEGEAAQGYQDVAVPRGFVTDLASIPRAFWTLIPPSGPYAYAAILHDFIYWEQYISRTNADSIFKIAMVELNVPGWKSTTIYNTVRLVGGFAWKKNARAKEIGERRILSKFPADANVSWDEWRANPDVFVDGVDSEDREP
jgi:hypothetical protein